MGEQARCVACWGHHLSSWSSQRLPLGGPGLQDNRFHTSTRGFCEGLLNARSGRPQKEVTTADSGIGDIPLDPSRCWPWTTCSLKTAGLQEVPPVLEATRAKSVPSMRTHALHTQLWPPCSVKFCTFGHALPLNHTLYSQPRPQRWGCPTLLTTPSVRPPLQSSAPATQPTLLPPQINTSLPTLASFPLPGAPWSSLFHSLHFC